MFLSILKNLFEAIIPRSTPTGSYTNPNPATPTKKKEKKTNRVAISNTQSMPNTAFGEMLDYDPKTGDCVWKERPLHHCASRGSQRRFNRLYAGKRAGCYRVSHPRISIQGRQYSLAQVVWYLFHGSWPKGPVRRLDGKAHNLSIHNLYVL